MKLTRISTPLHGVYTKSEGGLEWLQYWRGVRHEWYWHGIWVWMACRRRDRPMHMLIKNIIA
jgi:hypothetical protein